MTEQNSSHAYLAAYSGAEPREIAPGIWWIPECVVTPVKGELIHLHVSPFLIVGTEKTLLYDTGWPPSWPKISQAMDKILKGRTLDYVVPSHPEVGHAANTGAVLDKYPQAKVVGDVRDYPLFWPRHAHRMQHFDFGAELDLGGGYKYTFLDALIKDLPASQWGYESSQQVLFVSDGFNYSHRPPLDDDDHPTHVEGECTLLSSELPGAPGPDQIAWITRAALFWSAFVTMEEFLEPMQKMLADYPAKFVAPAHGAVIDNVDKMLWQIWDDMQGSFDSADMGIRVAKVVGDDLAKV